MQNLWQDIRYGARILLSRPGFSIVAVITLSLGIGANTAIFSVVNAVLLKPLPYRESDRLISRQGTGWMPVPVFDEWRSASQACALIAGYYPRDFNLSQTARGGETEYVEGVEVSAEFFQVLQVSPAMGRAFTAADFQPGAGGAVILSHSLWQRRFNRDPNVIGGALELDSVKYEIVGVMGEDFRQFSPDVVNPDLWTPLEIAPYRANGEPNFIIAIGRLKPESTIAQAQAEISVVAERVKRQQSRAGAGPHWNITLGALQDQLVSKYRPALFLLFAAVVMVLMIACVNLASLLLARAATRQKEFGIRAAMGAGRLRLMRQLLTESLLLAGAGGVGGVLLAVWGIEALKILLPAEMRGLGAIELDHVTLGFGLLLALLTGALFGLAPALTASTPDLNRTLKEGGGKSSAGARSQRWLRALVVSEVALAMTLMIGAGLAVNSFVRLLRVEPGFDPTRTLTLRLRLPERRYQTMTQVEEFHTQLLAQLSTMPGVRAVALTNNLPFSRSNASRSVTTEGQPASTLADFGVVSADYFRATGTPLVRGRAFAIADTRSAPGVAIVDESFARAAWPQDDPLGKRIKIGAVDSSATWLTVVGVARDARSSGLAAAPGKGVYIPYTQRADTLTELNVGRNMRLALRADGAPLALAGAARSRVQSLDPQQSVTEIKTMEQALAESISQPRFRASLLGLFAALSLALAGAGIYGVISFSVAERTRELGVRIALGAQAGDALRLVVKQGMTLALIGIAIGLAASLFLTRLMSNMLFGVSATDPLTYVAGASALAAVALLACFVPARRATKVDPMVALRCE